MTKNLTTKKLEFCRMLLEWQKEKEMQIEKLQQKYEQDMKSMREEMHKLKQRGFMVISVNIFCVLQSS